MSGTNATDGTDGTNEACSLLEWVRAAEPWEIGWMDVAVIDPRDQARVIEV